MSSFSRYAPVLDLPGVADLSGISIEEARRLAGEGWLPSTAVGEKRLFHRDRVIEWLRDQRIEPPDGPDTHPVG